MDRRRLSPLRFVPATARLQAAPPDDLSGRIEQVDTQVNVLSILVAVLRTELAELRAQLAENRARSDSPQNFAGTPQTVKQAVEDLLDERRDETVVCDREPSTTTTPDGRSAG